MANIGYIQVVRHCNHFCGFCSNPTTPYEHTFETMKELVDDFVKREYFGVILTGGEPSLHPELPRITAYARQVGLHVRMITNGTRLAEPEFARALAESGLSLVHVSIYSVRREVEAKIRGVDATLERAFAAIENAHRYGIDVNINCVINRMNADHLDENIRYFIEHHPHIRHFVWNNLDPSMGRAEVNQEEFTPRLAEFEASLFRALSLLHKSGRTFRVERVPLCYMTEFAWASTETRKIVKGEERIVHFLDAKQTVRQTSWGHIYAEGCKQCSLRTICGGLFDRGNAYDPAELAPVFVSRDA
nr:radical SAM protein [Polyangiaceae bacterium]